MSNNTEKLNLVDAAELNQSESREEIESDWKSYERLEYKNLLTETTKFLKYVGKSPEEVLWVSVEDITNQTDRYAILYSREERQAFDWEDFVKLADHTYKGNGSAVDESLRIEGDGWWLSRESSQYGEWWKFNEVKEKPKKIGAVVSLFDKYATDVKTGEEEDLTQIELARSQAIEACELED